MSSLTITKFTCDLCDKKEESGLFTNLPRGWVKLVFENKYVDRDFIDKHICKSCVESIVREAAKCAIT